MHTGIVTHSPIQEFPAKNDHHVVNISVFWLRYFLFSSGVGRYLSLTTIIRGCTIEFEVHCKLKFGVYAKLYEFNKTQNLIPVAYHLFDMSKMAVISVIL